MSSAIIVRTFGTIRGPCNDVVAQQNESRSIHQWHWFPFVYSGKWHFSLQHLWHDRHLSRPRCLYVGYWHRFEMDTEMQRHWMDQFAWLASQIICILYVRYVYMSVSILIYIHMLNWNTYCKTYTSYLIYFPGESYSLNNLKNRVLEVKLKFPFGISFPRPSFALGVCLEATPSLAQVPCAQLNSSCPGGTSFRPGSRWSVDSTCKGKLRNARSAWDILLRDGWGKLRYVTVSFCENVCFGNAPRFGSCFGLWCYMLNGELGWYK